MRAKLNQDTLIVAASRPGTAYLAMANDLSSAVGTSGGVRVLPVATEGGLANLRDALFLRGVDLTIVPSNVLAHAKASNAFGGGLQQRLAYVTLLYREEVHIVAGAGISAIGDLNGKRVAVPTDDGTAQFTLRDIFQRLGIAADSVPMAPADALDEVRAGTVAAAVLVGGKPLDQVSALPKDGSLRLLSLPFPVLSADAYAPAVLQAEDYPALIPPDTMVETVAVSAVLVTVKGEEAARRVAKHTPALLEAIAKLAISERHPRWRDVNVGAVLPGWSRAESAESWLRHASAQRKEAPEGRADQPPRTDSRVRDTEPPSANRRRKLMAEFDAWARKSAANGGSETAAK
jgi:TRAP transporter TAXI family solute receptor